MTCILCLWRSKLIYLEYSDPKKQCPPDGTTTTGGGVVIPTPEATTGATEADTTTTPSEPPFADDVLSFEIDIANATMTTDEGPQVVEMSAVVELIAAPRDTQGIMRLRIKRFSVGTSSAPSLGSESGGVSFVARPSLSGVDGTWDTTTDEFDLTLDFDVSYWLLTELLPPSIRTIEDEVPAPSEPWTGSLSGIVSPDGQDLLLPLEFDAALAGALVGGLSSLSVATTVSVAVNGAKQPDCPKDKQCDVKTICIQPVFIGTGPNDATKTGSSYDKMKQAADDLYKKCCIVFDWKAPKFVNKNDYKDTKGPTEEKALIAEEDPKGTNECIEVFFVGTMTDPATNEKHFGGDGVCYFSETKQAKVIVADEAVTGCNPPSTNVLAHELGHALGDLKHAGSAGTIMEPTGNQPNCPGLNPSKITEAQCKDLQHPDIKPKQPQELCCKNWDPPPTPTTSAPPPPSTTTITTTTSTNPPASSTTTTTTTPKVGLTTTGSVFISTTEGVGGGTTAETSQPPDNCPPSEPEPDSSCDGYDNGLMCVYGQECCCGECFDSFKCSCEGGQWVCLNTYACLLLPCSTTLNSSIAMTTPDTGGATTTGSDPIPTPTDDLTTGTGVTTSAGDTFLRLAVENFNSFYGPELIIEATETNGTVTNVTATSMEMIETLALVTASSFSESASLITHDDLVDLVNDDDLEQMRSKLESNVVLGDSQIFVTLNDKANDRQVKTLNTMSAGGRTFSGMLLSYTRLPDSFFAGPDSQRRLGESSQQWIITRHLWGSAAEAIDTTIKCSCVGRVPENCRITQNQGFASFFADVKVLPAVVPTPGTVVDNCCEGGIQYAWATGFKSVKVGATGVTLEVVGNIGQGANGAFTIETCCPATTTTTTSTSTPKDGATTTSTTSTTLIGTSTPDDNSATTMNGDVIPTPTDSLTTRLNSTTTSGLGAVTTTEPDATTMTEPDVLTTPEATTSAGEEETTTLTGEETVYPSPSPSSPAPTPLPTF